MKDRKNILIVGAGFYGATAARLLAEKGHQVHLCDRHSYVGGSSATQKDSRTGIIVHLHGPHIFHTDYEDVWNFVNRFGEFNHYTHKVTAIYNRIAGDYKEVSLPFSYQTFSDLWGLNREEEIEEKLRDQLSQYEELPDSSLKNHVLKLIGPDVYEYLVRHYNEKQWEDKCENLSPDLIKRLPIRRNWNTNYFNNKYQGIPILGYSELIRRMIDHPLIDFRPDFYFSLFNGTSDISSYDAIIYTGRVDRLFDFDIGVLEYRTLDFSTFRVPVTRGSKVLRTSVVNYTDDRPETRIVEHSQFMSDDAPASPESILTTEKPRRSDRNDQEVYYPVITKRNLDLYEEYARRVDYLNKNGVTPPIYLGGRLGQYKYLDMDETVRQAMYFVSKF